MTGGGWVANKRGMNNNNLRDKTRNKTIVMKFGGTSVANQERINHVAQLVRAQYEAGYNVAVVVSAMSGETNKLVGYVDAISPIYDAREYDAVVATGEAITAGLLALTLQNIGVPARSWQGWQIPIITDDSHGSARIDHINCDKLRDRFAEGMVAVITGFQGVSEHGRITTLGRGGSDTSAVAVAAALKADLCNIYTDVDGVYTTDPRIVPLAKKMNKISHEEMLELASLGAKVLHIRSVELAMNHGVRLQVLSSFEDKPGTFVVKEDEIMEQEVVSGIAAQRDEAKITLVKVRDVPGVAARIFGCLSNDNINVDMIIQSISVDDNRTDMTFTIPRRDLARTIRLYEQHQDEIGFERIVADDKVAKISIVGVGMKSHSGVAQKVFQALAEKNINMQAISTSEIKISVLISEEYTELAVRALHTAFGLDKQ